MASPKGKKTDFIDQTVDEVARDIRERDREDLEGPAYLGQLLAAKQISPEEFMRKKKMVNMQYRDAARRVRAARNDGWTPTTSADSEVRKLGDAANAKLKKRYGVDK